MKTFAEFMLIAEGMTMKDFKANRRKLKRREDSTDAEKRGHVGKEWHNTGRKYSPDEAKSRRAKMSDDDRRNRYGSAEDPDSEDYSTYPASKTKDPKKIRKQKAMGELGEAYDKDVMGSSQIRRTGEGGRIGADRRKTEPEKRRTRAAGGGKTEPAKAYKPRKDIGTQRQRSTREQQPTQERGSAALSAKEAQRKAYLERKARERGETQATSASQLLAKKKKATVSPDYKPQKASGKTTQERKALYKKGERTLRDIVLKSTGKKSEKELKHKYTSK